jgi:hypothetical protein
LRTPTYVSGSKLPSSAFFTTKLFCCSSLLKKILEDGNLLAETYVRVLKYILDMSLFLCICWSISDFWLEDLKEGDDFADPGVGVRLVLKCVSMKRACERLVDSAGSE